LLVARPRSIDPASGGIKPLQTILATVSGEGNGFTSVVAIARQFMPKLMLSARDCDHRPLRRNPPPPPKFMNGKAAGAKVVESAESYRVAAAAPEVTK